VTKFMCIKRGGGGRTQAGGEGGGDGNPDASKSAKCIK